MTTNEERGRLGRIRFETIDGPPPVLLVTPRGYIGPGLVRRDLRLAEAFAAAQTGPWWYIVDPTLALPTPVNIVFLRAVRHLPGVAGYFIVARRQPMRTIARLLLRLGGPHAVFDSLEDALRAAR
jgi:hypothetical protein